MRFKAIFLILSVFLTLSHASFAFDGSFRDFQKNCRENWSTLSRAKSLKTSSQVKGEAVWVSTGDLVATQPRFAYEKVRQSIDKHTDRHGAEESDGDYTFTNNDKKALYPLTSAIEVVAYRGKFYIIDGHHRWLTSVYTGAPTVPVVVVENWTRIKKFENFVARMEAAGYVYGHAEDGTAEFYTPCELKNDPNLYLARLLTLTVKWDTEKKRIRNPQGAGKAFLILKIDRGITRQEFEVADLLRRNGIVYQAEWGDKIPADVMVEIAEILQKVEWAKGDRRVMVFKKPQTLSKTELRTAYLDHLETCEIALSKAK
jgi:hypothetical protein